MTGVQNSETLWLIAANILLGLIILVCCVVIGWYVIRDARHRARQKKELTRVPDDYLGALKKLGVTAPDGGEEIDETKNQKDRRDTREDPRRDAGDSDE